MPNPPLSDPPGDRCQRNIAQPVGEEVNAPFNVYLVRSEHKSLNIYVSMAKLTCVPIAGASSGALPLAETRVDLPEHVHVCFALPSRAMLPRCPRLCASHLKLTIGVIQQIWNSGQFAGRRALLVALNGATAVALAAAQAPAAQPRAVEVLPARSDRADRPGVPARPQPALSQ